MTKQFTYDQTKETNRIKDKKIEIIEKIADFFVKFCNAITNAIFLVVLMRYFSEKNVGCDAIATPDFDNVDFVPPNDNFPNFLS